MGEARGAWLTFILSAALGGVFLSQAGSPVRIYPPFTASVLGAQSSLQDVAGISLGMHRILADIAWIQTLHYYGTPEEGQSEQEFHNGMGVYTEFLPRSLHVSRLDPYFTYVYYYGGAVLGWNLNRLSEAELLLREGIVHNPREWRLPQYLAGLAYQKDHDSANLIKFLEAVTSDPECPLLMKALLANIYKKKHLYDEALQIWGVIYSSGDPQYQVRANEEIHQIKALVASQKPHPPLTN